ncbi:pyrroline-5-carboxylate reductase 3-like [Actinia tenebrosa]|uniref:Pyrroline-5-carboxylate reductase n=1 Tax=Actinia tenebrosa TaxID=6105 RepID=A0A6P8IUV2_ACTTE|nr:pyrroline-5-carboxylate reductase 3-like [Actinia tenebrosa]
MADQKELRIGFVGGGNMAFAMARGFIKSELVKPENIIISTLSDRGVGKWKEMNCRATKINHEVVKNSEIVFIGVKPHIVRTVMKELQNDFTKDHLVVSIAAGVTLATFESFGVRRMVRVMPSLPCAVQQGASAFSCGSNVTREDAALVHRLMSSVGYVEEVKESLIDVVASISGSGSAFLYLVTEALADGAVKAGLPRPSAMAFAAHTVQGAGAVVNQTGKHPAQLKDETCSAGGSTIVGIHELEKVGVRGAFISAVECATKRAKELGN